VSGYTWVKADYSQIELRIAAWLANEPVMLQSYRSGRDLHMVTAKRVLGQETKSARPGSQDPELRAAVRGWAWHPAACGTHDFNMDIGDDEARMYHDAFFMAYPRLRQWAQGSGGSHQAHGRSVSPLGRVRHLPDGSISDKDLAHKGGAEGINHPVQSFASDMLS